MGVWDGDAAFALIISGRATAFFLFDAGPEFTGVRLLCFLRMTSSGESLYLDKSLCVASQALTVDLLKIIFVLLLAVAGDGPSKRTTRGVLRLKGPLFDGIVPELWYPPTFPYCTRFLECIVAFFLGNGNKRVQYLVLG
jgi:hypothetical protein